MNASMEQINSDKLLYVNKCGFQTLGNTNEHLDHFRWSDYHIFYVVEGSGYVKLDGKRVNISAGDLVFYLPWQYREYDLYRNKRSCSYYLHFNGEYCAHLVEKLKLSGGNLFHIGTSMTLTKLMDDLIKEFNSDLDHSEYMCQSYLLAILTVISRKCFSESRETSEINKQIDEICRYIYANCGKLSSVGELAQRCHLSESRFSHLFSEKVGISPKAYILAARVDVSKELLSATDHSVGRIAEAVGFNDQNYFSRVFKRYANMSPSEYRQMLVKSHNV